MIFLLDTSLLSEVMKPAPAESVAGWLRRRPADAICTSAVSKMEILDGIGRLPAGQRRQMLMSAALQPFDSALAGRVLPFDENVAPIHAQASSGIEGPPVPFGSRS